MLEPQPIGLANTLLPLGALGAVAVGLPRVMVRADSRSHREVAVGIWASAGILLLLGAVTFAALYALRGIGVASALIEAPLATTWFFVQRAGLAALVWGPVLALVWLGLAQRVERLKGQDGLRNGGPAE